MRDAEGRKKEASKVKQTTRQSNTTRPRQSLILRKMSFLGWNSNPRHSARAHVYTYTCTCMYMYIRVYSCNRVILMYICLYSLSVYLEARTGQCGYGLLANSDASRHSACMRRGCGHWRQTRPSRPSTLAGGTGRCTPSSSVKVWRKEASVNGG